ncbi:MULTISPECIES: hypothetical protein [unclassified Pseudomonas]|uniref:hypothetical protein n=1 Tax=unclassified Pseudomonas TaxID=196821 RepID=UPI000BC42CF7|nr:MULTISPECIES: hypothetical protein [unclassified Pseudomonas]PVZ19929.1 hypothetical protein F474_00520 [Pseudomonas sp. URIL14HWK12:I12]PVZ26995.1 hypothetical protein F470_00175 [Pseudomonas sp. URIL14HWK12:I10]PVZ37884.1 hypothetical protein F472_00520 [Pseudomonas sp. URIL14HWK12:I11]SNZ05282.1 hypothetical protein SAMN05660463_00884 [Pseudomonas sp. URIL14HWK12:I9]
MPEVTNNGRVTPIGLPNGTVIGPGETVSCPEWASFQDRKPLAFYVDQGILSVGEDETAPEELDKQDLLEQLKALGINANGNSKVATLQAKLVEAQATAKEREEVIAQLNEKGVAFEPTESTDELKAKLPAAE